MTMKLIPYGEALKMSKEEIDASLIPIRLQQAEQRGRMEQLALTERIITLKAEILQAQTAQPLCWETLIVKIDELALVERRQVQFTTYLEQMFPDEDESDAG